MVYHKNARVWFEREKQPIVNGSAPGATWHNAEGVKMHARLRSQMVQIFEDPASLALLQSSAPDLRIGDPRYF